MFSIIRTSRKLKIPFRYGVDCKFIFNFHKKKQSEKYNYKSNSAENLIINKWNCEQIKKKNTIKYEIIA